MAQGADGSPRRAHPGRARGAGFRRRALVIAGCAVIAAAAPGCKIRQNMYDQPKFEPYEATDFFGDRRSARPLVDGVVPVGQLREDEHLYTGRVNGELVNEMPFAITADLLERGQERFNIYCAPCHDEVGAGNGMVVQRGYKQPPSYHIDRLREMPVGYFYDVISNGFGVMASYAYQINPRDRWAVVAYIRALQLSQHAVVTELPEADQEHLSL